MADETTTETLSDPELAALAQGMLLIDDARLYGLTEGGPTVDRDQCKAVLDRLKREGVVPSREAAEASAIAFMREWNARTPEQRMFGDMLAGGAS